MLKSHDANTEEKYYSIKTYQKNSFHGSYIRFSLGGVFDLILQINANPIFANKMEVENKSFSATFFL